MIYLNVFSEETAWSKKIKNKKIFFEKICKSFPKKYRFKDKRVSFTILLSNNKNIKRLNRSFRNKNKPTDVLSFPFNKILRLSKKTYIGDIIISYDFIDKPKSQKKIEFKMKLIKTFIHGFLHLLNFDHVKNKDFLKMAKEEELIFKSVISKLS
tara:strand:- start:67 stop:528 length:462 start_codon:yes stop_codon:yes gene_type:complete